MGSFNLNCALTGMPIHDGEDARILFLTKNMGGGGSMTEVTQHFKPIFTFFLDAQYSDYGDFEFTCSKEKQHVVSEFFKEKLIPVEEGENQYHDIAINAEQFNIANVFEYMKEGRFFIKADEPWLKSIYGDKLPEIKGLYDADYLQVYFAAYKTSVLDRLFAGVFEHRAYDGKSGEYYDVMFSEAINAVPHASIMDTRNHITTVLYDHVLDSIDADADQETKVEAFKEVTRLQGEIGDILRKNQDEADGGINKVVEMTNGLLTVEGLKLASMLHGNRSANLFNNAIVNFMTDKNHLHALTPSDVGEFMSFTNWYGYIYHGTYVPTRYAGQEHCVKAHRQLANIVSEECDDIEKDYD